MATVEKAYQKMVERQRIDQMAAKSGGGHLYPDDRSIYVASGGSITASKLTTGISPTMQAMHDGARHADEMRRLHSALYDAKTKIAALEMSHALLIKERHELADALDERSEEAPRLTARLKGVITMLQDEENPRLDEAIWLLDKITYAWEASQPVPTPEAPTAPAENKRPPWVEEYIPF